MDANIKKELIDEIQQLQIKKEEEDRVEVGCSTSNWFASFKCSVSVFKMDPPHFQAEQANLLIDYGIQVEANPDGVRVFNTAFSHLYRHGPLPRFYSSKRIDRGIVVTIKNVGQPAMEVLGIEVQSEMYSLVLKFKDFSGAHRFVNQLERFDYNEVD
ncbi:hypothetical protein M3Y98_00426000 [Aphelenchoides besseyi]|nr:hypothetical protein M3Y98_00426000 [Aphelenchoides besseyi]KAI6202192.1 hypothetical protein M3Y96_00922400 [Aphelenchoides besseyi]